MNIIFYTLVILAIIYFLLKLLANTSSKKISKYSRKLIFIGSIILALILAVGGKFLINKIKVLNHKLLIANFSNGTFGGELFVKYTIAADASITFNVVEHFLYPTN